MQEDTLFSFYTFQFFTDLLKATLFNYTTVLNNIALSCTNFLLCESVKLFTILPQ